MNWKPNVHSQWGTIDISDLTTHSNGCLPHYNPNKKNQWSPLFQYRLKMESKIRYGAFKHVMFNE